MDLVQVAISRRSFLKSAAPFALGLRTIARGQTPIESGRFSEDDLPLARDVWPGRIEPTSVGECLQRHVTVGAQVTLYWWTAATTLAIASGTTAHPSRSPVKESWKERRGRDHRSDNPASVTLGVASRPGLGTAPRWFRPPTWRTRKKG